MKTNYLFMFCIVALVSSCNNMPGKISDTNDYNHYLDLAENKSLEHAQANREFWTQKLEQNPDQYPYRSKIASSYSHLFGATGNIEYLKTAEAYLLEVNEITNYNNPGSLMAMSGNYVSQHKFREALALLTKAELIGDHLNDIHKMLFDVHLELGNYELAKNYLDRLENMGDFDYLIRLSKWSDHQGNIDAAVKYLEKAKTIAESSKQKNVMQWTYTNLADYYGHAGNIDASYNHFLMALKLDPNDAYAKKGIAWIVYSHEKNPEEALRILNTVTKTYHAPDYYLLKAQIYEFKGDIPAKEEQLKQYREVVKNTAYGNMYNKYNVLLYTSEKENLKEAIEISKAEIKNRPTPLSYDLLAWSYYNNGNIEEAASIAKKHVLTHTSEPMALYHSAEILKAAGDLEEANSLKKELTGNGYELGPLVAKKVSNI